MPSKPPATGNIDTQLFDEVAELIENSEAGSNAVQYDKDGNPVVQKAPEPETTEPEPAEPETAPTEVDSAEETQSSGDTEETQEEPEPKAIDYDQEIPQADNQPPLTISAMKDEITTLRRQRASVEKLQAELLRDRILVNDLLADGQIDPEKRKTFEQANQAYVEREIKTIEAMFPQWSDETVKQADTQAMREIAFEAGATQSNLEMLSSPWIINLLYQHARLVAREKQGRELMKRQVKAVPQAAKTGKTPPAKPVSASKLQQFESALAAGDFETLDKFIAGA